MIVDWFILNEEGTVEINPVLYTIKPFSKFSALSRRKAIHKKIIAYIYWHGVICSPFYIGKDIRNPQDLKDIEERILESTGLDIEKDFEVTQDIKECIERFRFLQRSESLETLESLSGALKGIREYLKEIDLKEVITEGSAKGQLKHDPMKILNITSKLRVAVKEYEAARIETVEAYSKAKKVRGGGSVGALEDED